MAGKVILRQEEINTFLQDLEDYHREMITGLAGIQRKMEILNGNHNIFYMKSTSKNIKLLLDTIDTEIMPMLGKTLLDTGICAEDMIKLMSRIDK